VRRAARAAGHGAGPYRRARATAGGRLVSTDRRNVLQESLAAIERLQGRIASMESARHEPIAIVGMACRYPGGADTPETLWQLLRSGTDAVSEVPRERWDIDALHDPDPQAPGKMVTRRGGFLRQVDRFDPAFFGISPREANTLDPQQRLLLETATEALERAAIATDGLTGSATGVFIGITTNDYRQLLRDDEPGSTDVYAATGNALNAAAGRLSYTFGLQGPCVALDTACSSSLVAVHLACQSLRTGESRLALAGGVNVVLTPEAMVLFSKWGMMAPDGRCKTFDTAADGFVRAEGCAVMALKRLSDAVADGDPVLAVIRGSAVNSDGRSSGLTVPNGPAQEAVIRQALAAARLQPADIDYVEAHGTGTPLGDPIEVEALANVMGPGRDPARPLLLGAVKTNLGHTEAASGLAGLMKVVLSMQHECVPPHLHLQEPSPRIDWTRAPMRVPTVATPWPRGERPRRAGVSSFGFSGTNAHVVLEEAPWPAGGPSPAAQDDVPSLVLLAAHDAAALREQALHHADWLQARPALRLADFALTLATGRTHPRQHRMAFVSADRAALLHSLREMGEGRAPAGAAEGTLRPSDRARIAFVFTGQGAQAPGMGRGLYESEPVFRAVIDRAEAALLGRLEHPLTAVMWGAQTALLDQTLYTQPALYALEVALAELWRSWGIVPAVVLGHSVGEFAAACVAGVFGFEEGLSLVAERARLMQALPAGGAMAAVFSAPETVAPIVARAPQALSVAAVNGPEETVIAGDAEAVQHALAELAQNGVRGQALAVSHAFHSPRLEPMLDALERHAATLNAHEPALTLISNVTGAPFAPGARPDAAYWRVHARGTVRFAEGLRALRESGANVCVEIGPHPTLLGLAARAEPQAKWVGVPSLRRGQDDRHVLRSALGTLFTLGAAVRWPAVSFGVDARRVVLPTTAFQRERFWVERADPVHRPSVSAGGVQAPARTAAGAAGLPAGHPLLGVAHELASPTPAWWWETTVGLHSHPWLTDHRVQGAAIVPATAYIEMAIAAASEVLGAGSVCVRRIENLKPMILREGEVRRLQATLTPGADGLVRFAVLSREDGGAASARTAGGGSRWTAHMTAEVALHAGAPAPSLSPDDLQALRERCRRADLAGAGFYAALARKGNEWGPCFQGLSQVWAGTQEALARVQVPPSLAADATRYRFHPAVSDACGHALVATGPLVDDAAGDDGAAADDGLAGRRGAFVGAGVGEVRFHRSPRGGTLWSHARLKPSPDAARGIVVGDVLVYDEDGTLVGETLDARLWYLDEQASADVRGAPPDWFYEVQWPARARAAAGPRAASEGPWLVLADGTGVAEALAAARRAEGRRTVLVRRGRSFKLEGDEVTLPADGGEAARAAWRTLLQGLAEQGPLGAALHLWSLDPPQGAAPDAATLAEGPQAVLHLLHALRETPRAGRPRLWIATAGAMAVEAGGSVPAPAGALLWGLGRTLAAEHGELWGGLADLDPAADAVPSARALMDEVSAPDADDRVAWRGGRRFVPRLVRGTPDARAARGPEDAAPLFCGGAGTLLVTGGLGGIGLAMATWSVQRGVRHVVLLGRRGLPPRSQWGEGGQGSSDGPAPPAGTSAETRAAIAAVRAMEKAGAEVEVAALDVADHGALQALLAARAARGAPPVRGVFHAAGALHFEALDTQPAEDLAALLAAKVTGAWNLHDLLASHPLDFFVMCSSTSALLASPLLGAYAAGNAALDALAHHRHGLGLAALSINWGTWGEVGMAVRVGQGAQERPAAPAAASVSTAPSPGAAPSAASMLTGMRTMDTARALAAMRQLLERTGEAAPAQAAVMPVDWAALARAYGGFAADPFLEVLVDAANHGPGAADAARAGRRAGSEAGPGPGGTGAGAQPDPALRQLRAAAPAEQAALLQGYVRAAAARLLGMAAERLDTGTPLSSLGFDSLMAVQLKNGIEADLGVVVPMIRFLQGPCVDELVPTVAEALARAGAAAPGAPGTTAEATRAGRDAPEEEAWEEGTL